MSNVALLDTNILARYLLNDIPDHSARARQLIRSAARDEVELIVPATVITELAFLFHRRLAMSRQRAANTLLAVIQLQGLEVEHNEAITSALTFWRSTGGLSFVDCYHLALTKALGMTEIYTFDRKMDRFPGVERVEP